MTEKSPVRNAKARPGFLVRRSDPGGRRRAATEAADQAAAQTGVTSSGSNRARVERATASGLRAGSRAHTSVTTALIASSHPVSRVHTVPTVPRP
ncbi:hypothetical protein PUR61_07495 [Streptomyces sp. BE20]|uniref:hypothetical protein n=1 Tax=Streptomyces sp. BE20 TaxID=3002525 RepID=UPI002E799D39|nr:hypothetical protein [Streptomyces sp. BE20]MEE1822037.1 hypothetical protein [Streptomyces sp. BE20]